MEYIVLDLEWNQSPIGLAGEHPRLPFEIIEIGAIKLDQEFNKIGEFRRLVKPKLYPKLHKYIRSILSYDEKDLKREGMDFRTACGEFLEWCGEDYSFCTWGTGDLYCLQNNMAFHKMAKLDFPLKYYDIQQIFADVYDKEHNICKLEKAVERLHMQKNRPFHAAINDAYYTARIMQEAELGDISEKYTFDTYRHPKSHDEVIIDYHGGVIDEITEEYASKVDALEDSHLRTICCSRCGRKTTRRIKWFMNGSGVYYSVGNCFRHGNMLATARIKPASDSSDEVFVIKRVVPISKRRYKEIRERKEELLKKRREKERERLLRKAGKPV